MSGRQEDALAGTLAHTQLVRPQPVLPAGQAFCSMPFIDDDLLWCPDNDGKMVDLTQCLASVSNPQVGALLYGAHQKLSVGVRNVVSFL